MQTFTLLILLSLQRRFPKRTRTRGDISAQANVNESLLPRESEEKKRLGGLVRAGQSSPENLRHCLPSELQYACRYWVHHLIQNNPVTELTQVVSFLESHFLHWVEAMSLLGALSDVVEMVQRLRLAIPVRRGRHSVH